MILGNRAIPFFGLNGVRALSIIGLILVFASTILVMVTNIKAVNDFEAHKGDIDLSEMNCDYIEGSTVPNQAAGVFWAIVSSLLVLTQTVVLLLSEVSWPQKFFDRFFPVLGSNFGTGALGIFQCLISTQILSHHVDDYTLVAAFFLFSIGCLNMVLGLVFREKGKKYRSIRLWREDRKGALPTDFNPKDLKGAQPIFTNVTPVPTFMSRQYTGGSDHTAVGSISGDGYKTPEKTGMGFGRQGEKTAQLRGFILQPPPESLPRYAPSQQQPQANTGSLSRSHSTRSSTSSFSSPAIHTAARSSFGLEYADPAPGQIPPVPSDRAPSFRSSPTAI
jgi:hypothetical protein